MSTSSVVFSIEQSQTPTTVLDAEFCGLGHLLGGAIGHHRRICVELYQGGGKCCKMRPPAGSSCL